MKELETERLFLRKYSINDAIQAFQNWCSDPVTNKYVSWNTHQSVEETLEYVKMSIDEVENGGYHWVVELKSTNELIGDISVIHYNKHYSNCEIGYCYGSRFWGNGYATEALSKVNEYLLCEVGVHLVEAKYHSNNPASGKVMKKSGMKFDAMLRERRMDKSTKEIVDLGVYSITKSDLENKTSGRMNVKFYNTVPDHLLKFAVILARTNGKWILCKHKERDTYELPGGMRDDGESILETAKRELYEESGAIDFEITPISAYSYSTADTGSQKNEDTYGMFYFAEIKVLEDELHYEIEKIILTDKLNANWTYREVMPKLLEEAKRRNFIEIY